MPSSFGDFYDANVRRTQAILVMHGQSPQDAADTAADAFVRAWERWDRVRSMERPDAWVITVAFNLVRRGSKRRNAERPTNPCDVPVAPTTDLLPDLDLDRALLELTDRQREAILLRYSAGMSEKECAHAMGVRVGTASATLVQARSRLAALLLSVDPTYQQKVR